MVYSYNQESKNIVRKKVLECAIKYLTEERHNSSIVTEDYFDKMWIQSKQLLKNITDNFNINIDDTYNKQWLELHRTKVGIKQPSDLKVVYLCGPHPLNDLKILIDCGVRSENIWAVEFNTIDFRNAIKELKEKFPFIKVFNGKLERFIEVYPDIYDIVYFDSCKSIPNKEQKTHEILYKLFFHQKLSDLSVLITNFSKPDLTNEKLKNQFLDICSLFYYPNKIPINEEIYTKVQMSPLEDGEAFNHQDIKKMVSENFEFYYQHFITSFIYDLATFYAPYSRALQNQEITNIFVKKDMFTNNNNGKYLGLSTIEKNMGNLWANKKISSFGNTNSVFYGNGTGHYYPIYDFAQQYFIDNILGDANLGWFSNFFTQKNKFSNIYECLSIAEFLTKKSLYIDKDYVDVFNKIIRDEVKQCLQNNIFFDSGRNVSVDMPMANLPLQLLVYQIGFPYHLNVDKIKRFEYVAKETTMYTDLFVLDKCRYIYDWIPTVDLFSEGFKNIEIQLATRICINRLHNVSSSVFSDIFKYGTFFDFNEEKNNGYNRYSQLSERVKIKDVTNNGNGDEVANLVLDIKEVVNCFKNVEEKNILYKEALPCGRAYISGLDRRKAIIRQLIKKMNIYKDVYDILDREFYLNCYSNQSLKANLQLYNKVMNILEKYGIEGKVESYID